LVIPLPSLGVATLYNARSGLSLLLSVHYSREQLFNQLIVHPFERQSQLIIYRHSEMPNFEWSECIMLFFLGTLASLIAYAGGLFIVIKVTPLLLSRQYDEGLFMGIAAADIVGGILAFGAVMVTFALLNGSFGAKVLDFLLLVGILIIAVYMTLGVLRPRRVETFLVSRILAVGFCLLLTVAALYALVLLFWPSL